MSLILGLNLLRKVYLISDTRVTYSKNGKEIHEDNQLKFAAINPRISVVVAGNGNQASFFVNKIRKLISPNAYLSDLRELLKNNHKKIEKEYVDNYKDSGLSVFIFTGFNDYSGKKVESSLLGKAMSGDLVARGEGSSSNQSVDHTIIQALTNALFKKGELNKGDIIDVNVPNSEMFSVEIDTNKGVYNFNEIDCYKYAIFHPNYWQKSISVPDEIISFLEFRNVTGKTTEDVLYEDAEVLYNFVSRIAREEHFSSVGGHIFVALQSEDNGVMFPTGDLATIKDSKLVYGGKIEVNGNDICFELSNGQKGIYKTIDSIIERKYEIKM